MMTQFFSTKMLLSWLMTLGGIAILLYLIVRKSPGGGDRRREPLEAAKERYARGQITEEEYLRIKEKLK